MRPLNSKLWNWTPDRALTIPIGILAGILLSGIIVTTAFLSVGTVTRFDQIKTGWLSFSKEADEKGIWISEIRGDFGYGGMIHNFKNLVLRKETVYLENVRSEFARLYRSIDAYIDSNPSQKEQAALAQIRNTVRLYEQKLPIIEQAMAENWSPKQLDDAVKVNDTAALDGLNQLEQIWRQDRRDQIASLLEAFSRGEQLARWAFIGMVVMIALASILFLLMHFLINRSLANAEQLKQELVARKKAQEAEKKLSRAVEQSPTTIAITDMDGTIEYVNEKFCDLTGYTKEELIGGTPAILKSGYTSDEAYSLIWKSLISGQEWRGIFRNRKKDGSHYWASTAILPLKDEKGQITNYIGIGEDITEKKQARLQVIKAQKLEAVGLLAGGIAHDFNNILMVILGNVQLALLEAGEAENEEELKHIEIAARRAQSLVKQLLTFARRQPTSPRKLNLVEQVSEVFALLKASTVPTIDLTLETGAGNGTEECAVLADPTQLHQILMNLSRNAAEAIGSAPGAISIRLSNLALEDDPGLPTIPDYALSIARIDVVDNGPGVPTHLIDKVFDPFFSTKPIGKGTGLGLSVVRSLVEDMGGLITLKSKRSEGTTVSLFLPSIQGASDMKAESSVPVGGREQILVVDDEEEIVLLLRRLLTRLGYRVVAYSSSQNAFDEFASNPEIYDLLLTDLVMPQMDGQKLIENVRAIRPDLPVILATAYVENDKVLDSISNFSVLQKPVELSALANTLRARLDHEENGYI